ncbi:hypothetical protein AHAS_Ahas02G0040500 [Arachis hypogaea]
MKSFRALLDGNKGAQHLALTYCSVRQPNYSKNVILMDVLSIPPLEARKIIGEEGWSKIQGLNTEIHCLLLALRHSKSQSVGMAALAPFSPASFFLCEDSVKLWTPQQLYREREFHNKIFSIITIYDF